MDPQILQRIKNCKTLPAIPALPLQVLQLCRDEKTSAQRIGDVISARIASCDPEDEAVERSVLAAVTKASPLPEPSDPDLFRSELRITMRPPQ